MTDPSLSLPPVPAAGIVIPAGVVVPPPLAERARLLYLLGLIVAGREQCLTSPLSVAGSDPLQAESDYLLWYDRYHDLLSPAETTFAAHYSDQELADLARTFAGEDSYLHRSRSGRFLPHRRNLLRCAIRQTGYLVHRISEKQARGLSIEDAWTHLALEQHPRRGDGNDFHLTGAGHRPDPLPEEHLRAVEALCATLATTLAVRLPRPTP